MEHTEQVQVIASLSSSIGKLSTASQKRPSSVVVAKRLKAHQVGLAAIQAIWYSQAFPYTKGEREEAKAVLSGLFPSLERVAPKFASGTSQATLLMRRMHSLKLAIAALDEL